MSCSVCDKVKNNVLSSSGVITPDVTPFRSELDILNKLYPKGIYDNLLSANDLYNLRQLKDTRKEYPEPSRPYSTQNVFETDTFCVEYNPHSLETKIYYKKNGNPVLMMSASGEIFRIHGQITYIVDDIKSAINDIKNRDKETMRIPFGNTSYMERLRELNPQLSTYDAQLVSLLLKDEVWFPQGGGMGHRLFGENDFKELTIQSTDFSVNPPSLDAEHNTTEYIAKVIPVGIPSNITSDIKKVSIVEIENRRVIHHKKKNGHVVHRLGPLIDKKNRLVIVKSQ